MKQATPAPDGVACSPDFEARFETEVRMLMDRRNSRRSMVVRALVGLGAAWSVAGCGGGPSGPPMARVWGEVTHDGKPLPEGKIEFSPSEGTSGGASAGPIKDGKYDIPSAEGPIIGGKYRVEITANRPVGKPLENIIKPGGPPLQNFENYIPGEYNRNSKLTATISDDSSKNQLDFQLKGTATGGRRR